MIAGWRELFCAGSAPPDFTLPLRIARRHGEPLLLLPLENAPAARALDLYPAQTLRARVARSLLRCALRAGLPVPLEHFDGEAQEAAPFAQFLRGLAGGRWPAFAVLLGNPRAAGRRWLVLVFAPDGSPQFVVKVGVGVDACGLIAAELAALDEIPHSTEGRPALRDRWIGAGAAAFALDFAVGSSPRVADDDARLARLMESWIDPRRRVTLAGVPVWQRVRVACVEAAEVEQACAGGGFRPVLFHGDFAPWNVKVSGDRWTVLDWERGSVTGVPAWDWFHFVIQPALLVQRRSPKQVLEQISGLLRSARFQQYAVAAEITGFTDALLRGYLLFITEVIRPSEGLDAMRMLRELVFRQRPAPA